MTHKENLVTAFSALNDIQRGNLLWHVENGTEILCLERCYLYVSKDGAL